MSFRNARICIVSSPGFDVQGYSAAILDRPPRAQKPSTARRGTHSKSAKGAKSAKGQIGNGQNRKGERTQ
jgi:hypothetical protein